MVPHSILLLLQLLLPCTDSLFIRMHLFFYVVNLFEVVFCVLAALVDKLGLCLYLLLQGSLLLVADLLLLVHLSLPSYVRSYARRFACGGVFP